MIDTEFIKSVKSLPSIGEVINYTIKIYPKWIIDYGDKFSSEFENLNERWEKFMKNTKPAKILLVDKLYIENGDDEITKNLFFVSNLLISSGFLIRKATEYIKCENTGLISPTAEMQLKMSSGKII